MSSSSEAEFNDADEAYQEEEAESSDDEPLSSLAKAPVAKDDDEEDIDSDVPLSSLKSPKKKKKSEPKKKKKSKTPVKAKKTKAKTKSSSAKSTQSTTSSTTGSYTTASSALYGTECKKGLLIQRFLCRWWYALKWPDLEDSSAPPHYDAMDGFPGVYVCTSGDKVGHILDTRNHDEAPNFVNMARKPASELQTLLLEALENQRSELVEAEGTGTATEKEINDMIKWAQKLKPSKVDEEAKKVLKASKLSLP